MDLVHGTTLFACLISVQLLGLLSGWLARVKQGSRHQAAYHAAFYGLLALVGLTTMGTLALLPHWWIVSGGVLAAMVLTATCEVGTEG